MIEAKYRCGAMLDVPKSLVGQSAACGACNGALHFVAAELIAAGRGAGDFDVVDSLARWRMGGTPMPRGITVPRLRPSP